MSTRFRLASRVVAFATVAIGLCLSATLGQAQPAAPVLVSPSDGNACVLLGTPLVWNPVAGANKYEITVLPQGSVFDTDNSQLVVPGLVSGATYEWEVVAIDNNGFVGAPSARWSFTARGLPGAAVPVSPADGAQCLPASFTLDWSDVPDAVQYELRWGPAGTLFNSVVTVASAATVSGLTSGTVYEWQVRGTNTCGDVGAWSPAYTFTSSFGAPPAPGVLAPIGDTCLGTNVQFAWTGVTNASVYDLRWGPPGNPVFNFTTLDTLLTLNNLDPDTVFAWQVRAVDNCGNVGAWSAATIFGTYPLLGAPTQPVFPAAGGACLPAAFTLDWSDVPGAVQYELRYGPAGNLLESWITDTSAAPIAGLAPGSDFEWQVRASDNCGNQGAWSPVYGFSTTPSSVATPVPMSPANGSSCVTPPTILRWAAVAGASSYTILIQPGSLLFETATNSVSLPQLVAGTNYTWQVRAISQCGSQSGWSATRSFSLDGTAPTSPTLLRATPQFAQQWTNVAALPLSWTGGVDNCSVAGYSVATDTNPTTLPDLTIETSGTSIVGTPLPDGMTGWAHVRSVDRAGNGAVAARHLGPFWIDTTAPLASVQVPAADVAVAVGAIVRLEWTAADALSGPATVELRASNDGGASFPLLIASVPVVQTIYDWTAPDTPGSGFVVQLRVTDAAGNQSTALAPGTVTILDPAATAPELPGRTALLGNHPNPFNPRTTIRYNLAEAGPVELTLYDVTGRLVRRLLAATLPAGGHEVIWEGTDGDGRAVTSGVYLLMMRAGRHVETERLVLVR